MMEMGTLTFKYNTYGFNQHLQYAKWRRTLRGQVRGTAQGSKQGHQRVAAWLEGKETIKREKQKM